MMRPPVSLRGCRMVRQMMARLSRGGYLHVDRCLEHPRLTRHTKRVSWKHGQTVTWCVDGEEVATLQEAACRLAVPPGATDLFA